MTKYLVLGSSGQIGSALVKYLIEKNCVVDTFDIVESEFEDLRLHNNVLLEKKIKECDFIYFLAFDVGGSRYLKKYQYTFDFIDNNTKILTNTFNLIKKYNKPFIFSSSQMSNMSYSPYGVLKYLGEIYTKILNGVVVKFWNVYGIEYSEDKSHVITDFIKMAINDKKIYMLTDGMEERQFLYANDCCECLYTLSNNYDDLNRDLNYHITNFEWTKIIDIAMYIRELSNCEIYVGSEKDDIQNNKKNEPDDFIFKYWTPKTSIKDGISEIFNYYNNK